MGNLIEQVELTRLHPHPDNVRTDLGDVTELADSIRSQGVLEPLLVRPLVDDTFEIVAGHRRHAAAEKAGAVTVPVIVNELDDEQVIAIQLVENLHRSDLSPLDEARGYFRLVEFGWTQKRLSEAVGVSTATVRQRLLMLQLPEQWLDPLPTMAEVEKLVPLMADPHFDRDDAVNRWPTSPRPEQVERWLSDRAMQAAVEALADELPEDEPRVEPEAKGVYGTRGLPKNHIYLKHPDIPFGEDFLDVDVDVLRSNGHLGWHLTTTGYGDRRRPVALPVITDRGFYTRKSSSIDDSDRPAGWHEQQEEREAKKREKVEKAQREQLRRDRILTAANAAKKSDLEEVLLDRAINDLTKREFIIAAHLHDVMVYVEGKDGDVDLVATEAAVRDHSSTWQIKFVVTAMLVGRSGDRLATTFLNDHAPLEQEEDDADA